MEDSSMSEFNILHLPDHVIGRILDFVENRFVVSSVCRRFYQIDCFVTRKKLKMKINEEAVGDENILDSILNSNRICSALEVKCRNLKFIKHDAILIQNISNKFGATIVKLSLLGNGSVAENDILKLLALLPKLDAVTMTNDIDYVDEEDEMEELRRLENFRHVFDEGFTNDRINQIEAEREERSLLKLSLPELKKLEFVDSPLKRRSLGFFAKYLKQDTLETLTYSEENENYFMNFIEKQQKIKHLYGGAFANNFHLIHGLQLVTFDFKTSRSIRLAPEDESNFCRFLRSQKKLETFKLHQLAYVSENIFLALCSLKTLKNLKVRLDAISHVVLREMANLVNLENFEVSLATGTRNEGEVLSEIRFPKLNYLEIYHEYPVRDETRQVLEQSFSGVEIKYDHFPCY